MKGKLDSKILPIQPYLGDIEVTQTSANSVRSVVAEMRQIHTDYRVLGRKRDGMANLSGGEN